MFFSGNNDDVSPSGICLVEFVDGTLAQSYLPEADFRVPYAAETHGVNMSRLNAGPQGSLCCLLSVVCCLRRGLGVQHAMLALMNLT